MIRKNIISILVALIIMYLSLSDLNNLNKVPLFNIPHLDKIVHFGMYFVMMTSILFENRKAIKVLRHFLLIALIPLVFGITMEIVQSVLTSYRSGSIWDILFNSAGILASTILWIWFRPFSKEIIR
jgi:VanZ family protein